MTLTKDHIGGLVFLGLSIAYGYYAGHIPLLPSDEFEAFHAQTVPYSLAILGSALSIVLILTANCSSAGRFSVRGYDFVLVAKLLALVVLFALALEWLGFLVATALFLIGGYYLLGERRIKTLLMASIPFAAGIWLVLTQLLEIYLAPGKIILQLFGG